MISFENPAALALCLVPVAAVAAGFMRRKGERRTLTLPLDVWGGSSTGDAPLLWRVAAIAETALFALAWIALSIAASGPAREGPSASSNKSGLDIIFAIDASPSMAAMDLEPSRLEAAKALVRAYLESPEGATGAAVGVVAFGAEAALVCPPTTDYATVMERLDSVKPGTLGDGTALGQGLASALRQIVASGAPRAAAVLLSDGEDNVGLIHPDDAAAAFSRYGAFLLVVGLGARGDAPIDYIDPATGLRMSGTYRSGFDDDALASIAAKAGGEYRSAADSRSLVMLLSDIDAMGAADAGRSRDSVPARLPVGRPLFAAAMILAAAAYCLRRLALGGLA